MVATWSATLWLEDVELVDHDALGSARLIAQYRGLQPRLQGALRAYLAANQDLEDVLFEVLVGRWPLTAIGVQLDMLGRIVRQGRAGLTDDEYRVMILGRIFVNLSNGRVEEIYELLTILGIETIGTHEMYPAALHIDAAEVEHFGPVGDLLFDLKPGGVRFDWLYSDSATGTIFRTSAMLGADEVTTTEGTANIAGTSGGILSYTRWSA